MGIREHPMSTTSLISLKILLLALCLTIWMSNSGNRLNKLFSPVIVTIVVDVQLSYCIKPEKGFKFKSS